MVHLEILTEMAQLESLAGIELKMLAGIVKLNVLARIVQLQILADCATSLTGIVQMEILVGIVRLKFWLGFFCFKNVDWNDSAGNIGWHCTAGLWL